MENSYGAFHKSFWNELNYLTDQLRSKEDIYKLLEKVKKDERKKNTNKDEKDNEPSPFSINLDTNKESILEKIENIVEGILTDISNGILPKFILNKRGTNDNTKYTEGIGLEMMSDVKKHQISLANDSSLHKFAVLMGCLSVIYKLILSGKHSTKRDIFYSNVIFFEKQHFVDEAISDICCMLAVPRNYLNVLSSSKGFIGGELTFKGLDGNLINCSVNEGVQIPNQVEKLFDLQSSARFILIIEKEATYQRIIENKLSEKIGPCIALTGRGFPDINTRMMLKRLWDEFRVPVFAFVDADPHGIEIMCIYKYGSKSLSHEASYLTCPALKWIGIQPRDIQRINISQDVLIPLSESDVKKAQDLLVRSYIQQNTEIQQQIELLLQLGVKAEIECLDSLSRNFMTEIYLPHKIKSGDWI